MHKMTVEVDVDLMRSIDNLLMFNGDVVVHVNDFLERMEQVLNGVNLLARCEPLCFYTELKRVKKLLAMVQEEDMTISDRIKPLGDETQLSEIKEQRIRKDDLINHWDKWAAEREKNHVTQEPDSYLDYDPDPEPDSYLDYDPEEGGLW